MNFLQAVARMFGNPNAVFLTGNRLDRGQRVRVILEDPRTVVDGKAVGRRKSGRHIVRVCLNGRKWPLAVNTENILVRW